MRPEGRCLKCFAEIATLTGICRECRSQPHPFRKLSSCFENRGAARSLLHSFWKRGHFAFAKDIAAYLVVQMYQLDYPIPDLIIPIPDLLFQPHFLLAKEVAKMVNRPFLPLLKRHWTVEPTFSLKKRCNIMNQIVLLVDMQMQTPTSIRAAAWAVEAGDPSLIFGMTVCVT